MSFVDTDGSRYSIDSTEVEHSVPFTLEFHYFFHRAWDLLKTKENKHSTSTKDRSENLGIVTENNLLGNLNDANAPKYFVTYKFGQVYEGKSDILHPHSSFWSNAHTLDVNLDLLADFYEYPIEVKIMQVKKTSEDSGAQKNGDLSSTNGGKSFQIKKNLIFHRASLNAITKRLVTLSKAERLSPKTIRKIQNYQNYVQHNFHSLPPAIRIQANVDPIRPALLDLKIPPQPHHSSYMNLMKEQYTIYEANENFTKSTQRHGTMSRNSNHSTPTPSHPSTAVLPATTSTSSQTHPDSKDVFGPFTFKRPKTPPQPHHFDNPDRTVSLEPDIPKKTRVITEQLIHVGSIFVDPRCFFLGELQAKGILTKKVEGINEAEVKITLGSTLLTPRLTFNLNPMVITVNTVENLPDRPHSFEYLQKHCQPVYTCFAFAEQPPSRNKSHISLPHAKDLYFDSSHIILAGLHDEDELYNFFMHSTLDVKLHDRDLKLRDYSHYTSQDIEENLIHSQPHGIARFNLSELVTGLTHLSLESPVVPAEISGDEKKEALPSGFYLECDTRIKINVKCKGPIFSITGLGNVINRAILVLKKQDISILKTILQFVEDSNRAQLGLESIEELRRYRLSPEQRNNVNLDIVTGFLISDSEIFWLFFEGCLYNGMISLIELLKKYNLENDPNVITIIDTNLRYPHRQWTEVFPNICWIHLKGSVSKNIKSEKAFLSSYLSPETLKLLRTCHDDISLVSPSTFHMMFNTYSPSLETFCLIRDISLHASHFIDIESLAKFCPLSIPFEITLPPSSIMNQAKPVFSLPKLKKITPRQKATPENKKPVIKAPPRERSPLDFSRPIYLYSLQSLNTRRSLQKEVLRACQNTKNLYVFPFAPHRTLELNEI